MGILGVRSHYSIFSQLSRTGDAPPSSVIYVCDLSVLACEGDSGLVGVGLGAARRW